MIVSSWRRRLAYLALAASAVLSIALTRVEFVWRYADGWLGVVVYFTPTLAAIGFGMLILRPPTTESTQRVDPPQSA